MIFLHERNEKNMVNVWVSARAWIFLSLENVASLVMPVDAALVQWLRGIDGVEFTSGYAHGSMQLELEDGSEKVPEKNK
jgi:hypothetical protein